MEGQKLTKVRTLKTNFDNDCIMFLDDEGDTYLMKVTEILKLVNNLNFKIIKKAKHTYLEVI